MAQMSAFETLTLELVNRARLDPLAEAQRLGIDLNQGLAPGTLSGAAKQPLVTNAALVDGSRGHSAWMNTADVFSHTGSGGSSFAQRMSAAGYAPLGSFGGGENIAFVGTTGRLNHLSSTIGNHDGLFRSAGHRTNILQSSFREVGMGEHEGVFTQSGTSYNSLMLTQNFGVRGTTVFLGGVAFNDADGDNFYDVGEARGSVSVTVRTTGGTLLGSVTGEAAGAYAVAVAPQTIAVTFSGAGLPAPVSATVDASRENAKVDLLGTSKLLSSASITLGAGASDVTLLGVANINATGNAAANRIEGNKGTNILDGGLGNDTLAMSSTISAGTIDVMNGGVGNDTADFSKFSAGIWVSLGHTSLETWTSNTSVATTANSWTRLADLVSIENIVGTAHTDYVIGDANNNAYGFNGMSTGTHDYFDGRGGTDTADFSRYGSAVWVSLDYTNVEAWTSLTSVATTANATRRVLDLVAVENVTGTAFSDFLRGSTKASNVLTGGSGADTFAFGSNWGADTITDFQDTIDRIDLSAVWGLDTFAQLSVSSIAGGTATVAFAGQTITLTNLAAGTVLSSADFVL